MNILELGEVQIKSISFPSENSISIVADQSYNKAIYQIKCSNILKSIFAVKALMLPINTYCGFISKHNNSYILFLDIGGINDDWYKNKKELPDFEAQKSFLTKYHEFFYSKKSFINNIDHDGYIEIHFKDLDYENIFNKQSSGIINATR